MFDINFFTSCTNNYKIFVYPYISSVLINVPNSFVEINVDHINYFDKNTLSKLNDIFPDRFKINKIPHYLKDWSNNKLHPLQTNAIRFLVKP